MAEPSSSREIDQTRSLFAFAIIRFWAVYYDSFHRLIDWSSIQDKIRFDFWQIVFLRSNKVNAAKYQSHQKRAKVFMQLKNATNDMQIYSSSHIAGPGWKVSLPKNCHCI